jgi:hypothetical protein
MAISHQQLLTKAINKAHQISRQDFVKGSELDRVSRQRLLNAGYLSPIIRGWYWLVEPNSQNQSSLWPQRFEGFLAEYLTDRFGKDGYCLAAETSLDLQVGETTLGDHVLVKTKIPTNQKINLPFNTSLSLYQDRNFPTKCEQKGRLNLFSIEEAITRTSPQYFASKHQTIASALKHSSASALSKSLLESASEASASRVIGCLYAIGEKYKAKKMEDALKSVGVIIRNEKQFAKVPAYTSIKVKSPYARRIEALWNTLRPQAIDSLPTPRANHGSIESIEGIYEQDAYHSLSIEGYDLSQGVVRTTMSPDWNKGNTQTPTPMKKTNLMAARGYFEAFQSVLKSIQRVWDGENAGEVFECDLQDWYRAMFSHLAENGDVASSHLEGYRNGSVFIKGSRHIPPVKEAVPHAMDSLFNKLKEENDVRVRALLGHSLLGVIHPFPAGNGRIARLLMNFMLVTGGYSWTVIRVENRPKYMKGLEQCSCEASIESFAQVLISEIEYWQTHTLSAAE